MSPLAIILSTMLGILSLTALAVEEANVHANETQTAIRAADQLLPAAIQSFATQAGAELAEDTSITSYTTQPTLLCAQSGTDCWALASETVAIEGASTSAGTTDASSDVNANAGEERLAGNATVTITDPGGHVLAQRTRVFTLRTYDTAPYASIVDASDTTIATGTADADIAGCTGGASCGDNTIINSYVACNDSGTLAAPNPTAQTWENNLCEHGAAPIPTATPTTTNPWNELNTNALSNPTWANANAASSGWQP